MGASAPLPTGRPDGGSLPALPHRQGLGGDAYELIKKSIMDHAIAPGARMSIDRLARELGVSQTPVREALARLESDGLVVKTALKGYSASPVLSRGELTDLFGLRMLLEPWAAAEAAARLTDDDARRLSAEMDSTTEAPEGSTYDIYKVVAAHDARFHDLLLAAAGNQAVRAAFERTHCHLHIYRLYYVSRIGGDALREHRAVADAVLARDPRRARATMTDHLDASLARLLAAWRASSPPTRAAPTASSTR